MEENKNYVILPSDSNLNIYPDNLPSQFTVEFQSPIQFNTPQQCALFDISLPALMPQLKSSKVKIVYCPKGFQPKYAALWKFEDVLVHEYIIQTKSTSDFKSFYKDLIDQINNHGLNKQIVMQGLKVKNGIPSYIKDDQFSYENPRISFTHRYNKDNGKLIFGIKINRGITNYFAKNRSTHFTENCYLFFIFDDYIYDILFIPKNKRIFQRIHYSDDKYLYEDLGKTNKMNIDDYFIDYTKIDNFSNQFLEKFDKPTNEIYVLCSVIADSYINDAKVKILRLLNVNINGELELPLDNLMFFPVIMKTLKSISIEIVDTNFEPVQFQPGSANIVLCFVAKYGARYI